MLLVLMIIETRLVILKYINLGPLSINSTKAYKFLPIKNKYMTYGINN